MKYGVKVAFFSDQVWKVIDPVSAAVLETVCCELPPPAPPPTPQPAKATLAASPRAAAAAALLLRMGVLSPIVVPADRCVGAPARVREP